MRQKAELYKSHARDYLKTCPVGAKCVRYPKKECIYGLKYATLGKENFMYPSKQISAALMSGGHQGLFRRVYNDTTG